MSPTDKIIAFRSPSPPPADPDVQVEQMTEMQAAVVDMATFLLDNQNKIQNFVCGVACLTEEGSKDDVEFHLITSPIDARDYALALRLFEDGFRRQLGETIEE